MRLDVEELRHSVCVESCLVVLAARRLAEAIWDESQGRSDPGRVGGNAGVYMQRILAADSLRSIDKKLCAEMAGLTFNNSLKLLSAETRYIESLAGNANRWWSK